jgi:N utilization substance protein A
MQPLPLLLEEAIPICYTGDRYDIASLEKVGPAPTFLLVYLEGGNSEVMKSDFYTAVAQISAERGVAREVILGTIEEALASAYKRAFGVKQSVTVKVDPNTGNARVYAEKVVVDQVSDPSTEISLQEARRIQKDVQPGDTLWVEVTPKNFGRIAAQTAKQVLFQKIREAEREHVYEEYADRKDDIVTGIVQRFEPKAIILDLGRAEAVLPQSEQVPTERYRLNQRLKVYLLEVNKTARGPQLIVSRTHRNLLKRLLELEVPEIANGIVEIKAIAREPGLRSKVAVWARQPGIDPVGSCIGVRGVRIQNVVNELSGEKIDVIQWDPDPKVFIANALSPAQVISVELNEAERTATVIVPERHFSLAIGKEGQNVRLAAKLTGWKIDIKSASEVAKSTEEGFAKLASSAAKEADQLTSLASAQQLSGSHGEVRKVRRDGTFVYKGTTYGPLPPHLAGETVVISERDNKILVLWHDELVTSFEKQGVASQDAEMSVRKVRKGGTVVFRNGTYGPLPPELEGEEVQVSVRDGQLVVIHNGQEVGIFPLTEEGVEPET